MICTGSCNPQGVTWYFHRPFDGVIGFDKQGRLQGMFTTAHDQLTSKGIHAGGSIRKGSTLNEVRHAYATAKCYVKPPQFPQYCQLKSRYHGRKVTTTFTFYGLKDGVGEIEIDYVQ